MQKLKFLKDRGLAGTHYTTNIETSWRRRDDYYAIAWRGKWKTELGGCCLTHSIHAHDILTYICGPVKRAYAKCTTRPYDSPGDPWKFAADTPELQKGIDAAFAEFQPEPEHYAGQFVRFHSALENGTPLPATLADARQSLELITAIYSSSETGQPVDLPLAKNHPNYASWTPAAWRT